MCLWPGYHLRHNTAKHGYSGVVKESTGEGNGALLSSLMRVGSVYMRIMNIHVYSVDLAKSDSGVHLPMTRDGFFFVLIFLLSHHKISEFCINCFKFTRISQLIFINIIRESFVTKASK